MQMPYNVFLLGVGPIINASIITSTVMALPGPWDALPGFRARIDSLKDSGHEVSWLHGIIRTAKPS